LGSVGEVCYTVGRGDYVPLADEHSATPEQRLLGLAICTKDLLLVLHFVLWSPPWKPQISIRNMYRILVEEKLVKRTVE
jgi:hypothetical protein